MEHLGRVRTPSPHFMRAPRAFADGARVTWGKARQAFAVSDRAIDDLVQGKCLLSAAEARVAVHRGRAVAGRYRGAQPRGAFIRPCLCRWRSAMVEGPEKRALLAHALSAYGAAGAVRAIQDLV